MPAPLNKMNAKGAPQMALLIVGVLTEVFIIVAKLAADAYAFAIVQELRKRSPLWTFRLSESRIG